MCHDPITGFFFFHRWNKWSPPDMAFKEEGGSCEAVSNTTGLPALIQRRECVRCAAVEYRVVQVRSSS